MIRFTRLGAELTPFPRPDRRQGVSWFITLTCLAVSVASAAGQDFTEVMVTGGDVALTGAKVIDGTGAAARTGQTIVIQGDRIAAVGPDGSVDIPSGIEVLDLSGHTVIPGLIGMHNHSYYTGGNGRAAQLTFSGPVLYLASSPTQSSTSSGKSRRGG
jgi:hypothetical protein